VVQELSLARPVLDRSVEVSGGILRALDDLAVRLDGLRRQPARQLEEFETTIDELRNLLSWEFAALLGPRLDRALPLPAGMGEVLELLVVHDEVSSPATRQMIARYLETWQSHGREHAGTTAWDVQDGEYVARDSAPADIVTTLVDPRTGEAVPVRVGVETDPVRILLGAANCAHCAYGTRRQHAQDYLHRRAVMVRVWARTPEGERGEPLATLYAGVLDLLATTGGARSGGGTRKAVVPLSQPFAFGRWRAGSLLDEYLRRWAAHEGWPVVYTDFFDEPSPTRLAVPPEAKPADVVLRLPADDVVDVNFYTEVIPRLDTLPVQWRLTVRLWEPGRPSENKPRGGSDSAVSEAGQDPTHGGADGTGELRGGPPVAQRGEVRARAPPSWPGLWNRIRPRWGSDPLPRWLWGAVIAAGAVAVVLIGEGIPGAAAAPAMAVAGPLFGGGRGSSGGVISGGWREGEQSRWEQVLPDVVRFGRLREDDTASPRAPPVLEIPVDQLVLDILEDAGLGELPGRLVGYIWDGRLVVLAPMLALVRAAGVLDQLREHGDVFHLQGRAHNAAGLTGDEDAGLIVDELVAYLAHTTTIAGHEGERAPVPLGYVLALSPEGRLLEITGGPVLEVVAEIADWLDSVEQVRQGDSGLISPRRWWAIEGLGYVYAGDFKTYVANTLTDRGLGPVTVLFYLDISNSRAMTDLTFGRERVSRLDLRARRALEALLLTRWQHPQWALEQVWRHVIDGVAGPAHTADPRTLPGLPLEALPELEFEKSLDNAASKTVPGRGPKVMLMRDAHGERWVVKHRQPNDLISTVWGILGYRMGRVPVAETQLMVATRRISAGKVLLVEVGDVVEVARFYPGKRPSPAGVLRGWRARQLAPGYGITALFNDADGLYRHNLLDVAGELLGTADEKVSLRIDTDQAFGVEQSISPLAAFVLTLQLFDQLFGRLPTEDVLGQLADLLVLGELLLPSAPNEDLHRMLAVRLQWVSGVLADGYLPPQLARELSRAQAEVPERLAAERPAGGYRLPTPHTDRQEVPPDADPVLVGRRWFATGEQLSRLAAQGRPVWLRRHWSDRGWEATLLPGDGERVGAQPWTAPPREPVDAEQVRSALRELGRNEPSTPEQGRAPPAPRPEEPTGGPLSPGD
jgi:hypothetical protein